MKTKTLLVAALMLAAGCGGVAAQSNVPARNIVGYVNTPLTGNGRFNAVANPFNATNNTIGSLLANLPNSSQVLKWNHALLDFVVINKTPFGTWTPAGSENTTLNPGEGVLIRSAAPWTNVFLGEVLQGSLTNPFPSGYEMLASKVPEAGLVRSTLGLTTPGRNSQLLKWNSTLDTLGDWQTFNFFSDWGWSPTEPTLDVGEPFLLFSFYDYFWVRNFTVP